MGAIEDHINREKGMEKPDIYIVRKLEAILGKGVITMKEWIDTGRFYDRESYLLRNPSRLMASTCTDVIEYAGGVVIEALKNDKFYVSPKTLALFTDSLTEAEEYSWELNKEKLF